MTLRCACLVATREDRLLLVRVRDNALWYLPGGKIEPAELPEETLTRELFEELGIVVDADSVRHLYSVRGPAYGRSGEVELVCFAAQWENDPRARGEVAEVAWIPTGQLDRFAPAVRTLCRSYL
jgi:8-oxo-dGTP pyrophosphatase MutT (NUDIX family)